MPSFTITPSPGGPLTITIEAESLRLAAGNYARTIHHRAAKAIRTSGEPHQAGYMVPVWIDDDEIHNGPAFWIAPIDDTQADDDSPVYRGTDAVVTHLPPEPPSPTDQARQAIEHASRHGFYRLLIDTPYHIHVPPVATGVTPLISIERFSDNPPNQDPDVYHFERRPPAVDFIAKEIRRHMDHVADTHAHP